MNPNITIEDIQNYGNESPAGLRHLMLIKSNRIISELEAELKESKEADIKN